MAKITQLTRVRDGEDTYTFEKDDTSPNIVVEHVGPDRGFSSITLSPAALIVLSNLIGRTGISGEGKPSLAPAADTGPPLDQLDDPELRALFTTEGEPIPAGPPPEGRRISPSEAGLEDTSGVIKEGDGTVRGFY